MNSEGSSPPWNVLGQGNMTQELTVNARRLHPTEELTAGK
jgi:hypothetical protein